MSRTRQQRFIPDESLDDVQPIDFSPREESPSRMPSYVSWPNKLFNEDSKPVVLESNENAKSKTFSPANVS